MLVAMSRIAIIGGGNIGEALISGLLRAGRQAKDIVVSEKVPARARALADAYSIRISEVADAVEGADFIVVAVKPSDVESATTEIAAALAKLTPRAASGKPSRFWCRWPPGYRRDSLNPSWRPEHRWCA